MNRGLVGALSTSVAIALLTGCNGSQPSIGAPGTMPQSHNQTLARTVAGRALPGRAFNVLYRLRPQSGGVYPVAGLTDVNGTLYGTTSNGGGDRYGTVYRISPSGDLKVLHRFHGGPNDGQAPQADLLNVNGTLYGTTTWGGKYGLGTVFSITTAGVEKVLHSFNHGSDGALPYASMINVNGTLYGTTSAGGAACPAYNDVGCGTVYSITTAGTEKVLHAFAFDPDGAYPFALLHNVNGILYGTTRQGGSECGSSNSCGTVFSVTTSGDETVLYRFAGRPDAAFPNAGLTEINGLLYGTTYGGGAYDRGTVYRIATDGVEQVLHSFKGGTSPELPNAGLISINGMLYGTSLRGGTYCGGRFPTCGTVFRMSTGGSAKIVHRFSGDDGAYPQATLLELNGTLYGTTTEGGSGCHGHGGTGCGTVFALNP